MLFGLWSNDRHRPTKDLDLLGQGEVDVPRFEQVFREICPIPCAEDGIAFKSDTVKAEKRPRMTCTKAFTSNWKPNWLARGSSCKSISASAMRSPPVRLWLSTRLCSICRPPLSAPTPVKPW